VTAGLVYHPECNQGEGGSYSATRTLVASDPASCAKKANHFFSAILVK